MKNSRRSSKTIKITKDLLYSLIYNNDMRTVLTMDGLTVLSNHKDTVQGRIDYTNCHPSDDIIDDCFSAYITAMYASIADLDIIRDNGINSSEAFNFVTETTNYLCPSDSEDSLQTVRSKYNESMDIILLYSYMVFDDKHKILELTFRRSNHE